MAGKTHLDTDPIKGGADIHQAAWQGLQDNGGPIRCVFSTRETSYIGTGTTKRAQRSKLYWLVEEMGEDEFAVRKLNGNYLPIGDPDIIGREVLLKKYYPEIRLFEEEVIPAMESLDEKIERGEHHREEGRLYSAEREFDQVLELDITNIRSLFGLGIIYLERGEQDRAAELMHEIVEIKSAFSGVYTHLFNEFGIKLRKNEMLNESVMYYSRALELAKGRDENLHYNLARAHYELGSWEPCFEHLAISVELNPTLKEAFDLLELIVALSMRYDLREKYSKPEVPAEVAVEAAKLFKGLQPEPVSSSGTPIDMSEARVRYDSDTSESELYASAQAAPDTMGLRKENNSVAPDAFDTDIFPDAAESI